ncbi:MAG: translation initiation factor IF-3 [Candidatus Saganbacteria bacterium]|uniref:Translation initiation factor IF-3 n=1 Tax=Candidatus Saganbacteria bacterium TaxID=2575572 RepID=A0A833L258_UNCSA|nr:MAG: translation initiation factor IF-3 [Candidatus Saganbacteria bacterium]
MLDFDGAQLGIQKTFDALRMAREKGLDLILISPNANPPVAKITDFGKFRYEIAKHEKEAKKSQKAVILKEIKLTPKIGEHDLNVRIAKTIECLQKRNKVKVNVFFRGREVTHKEFGERVLNKLVEASAEFGKPEAPAKIEGRNMVLVLVPK